MTVSENNGAPGTNQRESETNGLKGGIGGGDDAIVVITINGTHRKIHSGAQTVATIKQTGNVPLADDLEQVVHGRLVPLADDATVTIKGDEQFVSHPKDSGSS